MAVTIECGGFVCNRDAEDGWHEEVGELEVVNLIGDNYLHWTFFKPSDILQLTAASDRHIPAAPSLASVQYMIVPLYTEQRT